MDNEAEEGLSTPYSQTVVFNPWMVLPKYEITYEL
eukprot:gene9752-18743_t